MTLQLYHPVLGLGDFSDLFLEESSSVSLRWEEGRLDSVSITDESGAGLRFLSGDETRYGHIDLARPVDAPTKDGLDQILRLKERLSPGLITRAPKALPPPSLAAHPVKIAPAAVPLEKKIELLRRAHAAATGPHLRQVAVTYGEKTKRIGYLNSEGTAFIEDRTYVVFTVTVTVERNGDLQTAYEALGGLLGLEAFDGDAVERLARDVAVRAHKKLDSPQAPAGEMAVVIAAEAGGTLIHEAVGHSLEADAVLEGTSPSYKGKIGSVVANEKLTVYDDPTVALKRGSFRYDDEGTPSEPSKLIENGVLRDLMWDRLSARKAGRASNGHGRRESYAHRPIPRMSNTFIAPGPDDPKKILASVPNGLLVTRMGGGQVNTANGDFVFEVEEGFQLKDGKPTMVRGATLLGNGPETLKIIDMVGTDHGWGIGTCGKEGQGVPVSDALPTIRVPRLVVGGQGQ